MKKQDFLAFLEEILQSRTINDYCPNGLQVEASDEITKIVTGVTASQALIDEAIKRQADCLLVHHGYFWKGEDQRITGIKMRRIKALLDNGINLVAYHLPIDVHPQLGNNVQLGQQLGLVNIEAHPEVKPYGIIMQGELANPITPLNFSELINKSLKREPMHIEAQGRDLISTVAWCTGGGQNYIEQAAELNVDAFISGEISEQTTHLARELGVHYFAAGHHATERYGVKALGEYIAANTEISVEFVDVENPA